MQGSAARAVLFLDAIPAETEKVRYNIKGRVRSVEDVKDVPRCMLGKYGTFLAVEEGSHLVPFSTGNEAFEVCRLELRAGRVRDGRLGKLRGETGGKNFRDHFEWRIDVRWISGWNNMAFVCNRFVCNRSVCNKRRFFEL